MTAGKLLREQFADNGVCSVSSMKHAGEMVTSENTNFTLEYKGRKTVWQLKSQGIENPFGDDVLPTSPASGAFDSVTVETATGAYGKLPFHGDFVTRDLPPDFIRQWDEWLQRALQASKDAMQTHWHDTFLTSPIWRFVIAPGIVGDSCWMGCAMSQAPDSVGRIFPVTFAREYPQETNPFLLAMLSEAWMQGLKRKFLRFLMLREGSVDTILDRVNALEPPTLAAPFPGQ